MTENIVLKEIIPDLKPFLQSAWDKAGFQGLTPIQQQTIQGITEGKDIIAESPTGSGKTLAYLLPLLQQIDSEQKDLQVVIMASSHELVMQIHQEIQEWGSGGNIRSTTLIGGANIKRQLEKLKKRPNIVIGTPGRIQELIKKKKLKMHNVKTIVLDEADQLLVSEHIQTVEAIIKSTLSERQLLLFSATLPEEAENKARQFMNNPGVIRVGRQDLERPAVEYIYFSCESREKIELLRKIVKNNDIRALVFVRDIGTLTVLAEKLEYMGINVGVLHSDANKQTRSIAIKKFREGELELLLATDVAARGLDIPDLTHVIHMDMPQENTQFIHRSGRTGRLGSTEGTVIVIVNEAEERILKKFSRQLDINVEKRMLYKGQIVNAREKGKNTKR